MEDIVTPFDLFCTNLTNKLRMAIESLVASNVAKDLILSESFKRLLYANYGFGERLEKEKISVSFYETLSIPSYDLNIKSIILISSSTERYLRSMMAFLNEFCEFFKDQDFSLYMLIYPRRDYIGKQIIETMSSERVKLRLKAIRDLNFDFFPLEDYLLDLDYEQTLSELYLSNEYNVHNLSAESLYKFQLLFGQFNNLVSVGPNADKVVHVLDQIHRENRDEPLPAATLYHNCIVIDRNMDLVTPLMTQFTYTGLLDEVFGVKNNLLNIPANFVNKTIDSKDKIYFNLKNDKDPEYRRIKDYNYTHFVNYVKKLLPELEAQKVDKETLKTKGVSKEMLDNQIRKDFMEKHLNLILRIDARLKQVDDFEKTTYQTSVILGDPALFERLVDDIQIQLPIEIVLNLLILTNFYLAGFTARQYEILHKELLDAYGVGIVKTLMNLEKAGLFVNKDDKDSNFELVNLNNLANYKKIFEILDNNVHMRTERDISTCYNGYIPILVKIIESVLHNTPVDPNIPLKYTNQENKHLFAQQDGVLLFVVGGVSYSEVSCLQRLASQNNKNMMICTTNVTNSSSLVNTFLNK